MLISFEFPDRAADLSAGKKTLTVRLGLQSSGRVVNALIGSAYLFLAVLTMFSKYPGQWMGLSFPLAIWQMVLIHRVILSPTRVHYHLLTAVSVGLFALMSFLALLGLAFSPVSIF